MGAPNPLKITFLNSNLKWEYTYFFNVMYEVRILILSVIILVEK